MGIVAQEDYPVVLDLKVEPAVYSPKTSHASFNLFISYSVQVCQCHSGYAIFYIDTHGHSELDIIDTGIRRHKVYKYLSVSDADILCMEVALVT